MALVFNNWFFSILKAVEKKKLCAQRFLKQT